MPVRTIVALSVFAPLLALTAPARAEVIRFDVTARANPAFEGRQFGDRGKAEKIVGTATIALDPANPRNQTIVDLDKGPRDAKGRVEATADVIVLRPARPNGTMLVELPNRGGGQIVGMLNDVADSGLEKAADAGNGFLLEQGFTLVWIGWQGDLKTGIAFHPPIAKGLTGRSRDQWTLTDNEPTKRFTLSWPAAEPANASILFRPTSSSAPTPMKGLAFKFIDERTIEVTRGAVGTGVYELIYTAKDPAVMGMGLAALRDVTTFLRRPGAGNPLGRSPGVTRTIATGVSQTGRVLRDLLYNGLNEDEAGRKVFDGMIPIIPGTRRSFTNARFAQPGRNPGPEWDQFFPVDQFPFTYATTTDALTGKSDGLLRRCTATNTCPRIMETASEYEFYGSRASLLVTDTQGKAPVALPANVRAYLIAGAPHSNRFDVVSKTDPRCLMASSPVIAGPALRALLLAMDEWLRGVEPPASRFPSLTDGTLVPPAQAYAANQPLPFRAQYMRAHLIEQRDSGPVITGEYPVLLPKSGPDGNVVSGIRLPIVAAPRATYTGWNPQIRKFGPEDLCDHAGGMMPFAQTRAERVANGDPRPSIEELYPTPDAYTAAVKVVADQLVAARLMLRRDADAAIEASRKVGP